MVDRFTRRDDAVLAWPVHAAFAVNGLLFATWVSRLPAVRERLGASEPQLGSVLLCIAIGSLVSMPFTSRLCDRFGVHRVLTVAMLGCAVAFELAVLAPSIPTLGAVLFVLGTAFGTWDVAMNSSAHEVEVRTGRPLMPRFHGAFSVGGLSGGALGAVAAGVGLPVPVHMAGAVVVAAAAVLVAVPLLPEPPRDVAADTADVVDSASDPRGVPFRLIALGLLTACTTLGEGAAADWGALFLHDERGASESTAALGYAVFCCAMAIGRFGGTWVLSRIERVWALRWSGVAVSTSLVVLVAIDVIPVSLLAMAGWGFGVAIVFPAAMSAAAEHAARPAHGIAVVATIGYGGFLVGPPLIGFLAGHVGLGSALWVVAGLGVVLFGLSVSAAPRQRPAEPVDDDRQPVAAEFLRL
jgi:MFS family permease